MTQHPIAKHAVPIKGLQRSPMRANFQNIRNGNRVFRESRIDFQVPRIYAQVQVRSKRMTTTILKSRSPLKNTMM